MSGKRNAVAFARPGHVHLSRIRVPYPAPARLMALGAIPALAAAAHFTTVKPGDTLSAIAQRECHSASDWTGLWHASHAAGYLGPDPDLILPGQRVVISCTHADPPGYTAAGVPVAAPAGPAVSPPSVRQAPVTVTGSGMRACIIARESGGNPSAVNPASGAGGLYQFLPSTWAALGHSGLPENASVAEQNQAFAQEVALSGYSAWTPYDGC